MSNPIYSITPFTLLDYPDKTACILWFAGCNMRCLYCYNPAIVLGKGKLNYNDAIKFLRTRKNLLDGVVLSGGECTAHKDLPTLCNRIKDEGMLIKIDTNGTHPTALKKLLQAELADYIALDYKAPAAKYAAITQSDTYTAFKETFHLLINSTTPFEIRTTIHTDLLNEDDLCQMIAFLETEGYKGKLYLQHFINDTPTLGNLPNTHKKLQLQSNCIDIIYRN